MFTNLRFYTVLVGVPLLGDPPNKKKTKQKRKQYTEIKHTHTQTHKLFTSS